MPLFKNGHIVNNTGRTWWKKGHIPWNKGKKGIILKPRTGKYIICKNCGNKRYYQLNELKSRNRKYCSSKCHYEYRRKYGSDGYQAVHTWLRKWYGKAKKCNYCGTEKNVEWANISLEYKKDINDWIPLCRKDHIAFDKNIISLKA